MDTAAIFYLIIISMILLLFVLIIAAGICFIIFRKRKEIYKDKIKEAETYVADVKKRTDMQYKKLIQLSPKDLDEYLGLIFSYYLELNSESRVSEKDPAVVTKLYATILNSMLEYLGDDVVEALDYYYGEEFVEKWCQLRYLILENRRTLSKVINKSYNFAAVQETNTPEG